MHAKTFPIWHFMHKCRCLQRWLIDLMKIKFIKQNAKRLPATASASEVIFMMAFIIF